MKNTVNWQATSGTQSERLDLQVDQIEENTVFYETDTHKAWIMIAEAWEPFPGAVDTPQTQQFAFSGVTPGSVDAPLTYYLSNSLDGSGGTARLAQIGYPSLLETQHALFAIDILGGVLPSAAEVTLRVNDSVVATISVPSGSSGILPAGGVPPVLATVPFGGKIDVAVTVHDATGQLVLSANVLLF